MKMLCAFSFVTEHDGARCHAVKQAGIGECIVRLARRQAEPDREPLSIDDRVDLGREGAAF